MLPLSLQFICNIFYSFFSFNKAKVFIYIFFLFKGKGEFTRLVEKISFWTQLPKNLMRFGIVIGPDKNKGLMI